MNLNARARGPLDRLLADPDRHHVAVSQTGRGGRVVDCGAKAPGGLAAGVALADICLAGLADVRLVRDPSTTGGVAVQVATDHPVEACMGAQYAGWELSCELPQGKRYFAMGSGPMRAAGSREPLLRELELQESAEQVVGVLETAKLPGDEVFALVSEACRVEPSAITLAVARTASLAGTLQVVARSIETALHKLHELRYDLTKVRAGFGTAPLPPVAADDLTAIGWTNDAVLFGGEVTLWVEDEDDLLRDIGPRVPSSASPDYGRPFGELFRERGGDFYKIDPLLFSPASICLVNLRSGRTHSFGRTDRALLERVFGGC